jgi:hypothetical protein
MDTARQVALILLAVVAVQALVWIPILRWAKKKRARILAELREELASSGERVDRGPEPVRYSGATAVYSGVSNTAIAALTDRRLVIHALMGRRVELPVTKITGVREEKMFRGQVHGGSVHVVIATSDPAEIGLRVTDTAGWVSALRRFAPAQAVAQDGPTP